MKVKKVDKSKGFFLKVSDKVHKDFKVECALDGFKMTDVVELLMIAYKEKGKSILK